MDNVQNCDSYTNIPLSQTYGYHLLFVPTIMYGNLSNKNFYFNFWLSTRWRRNVSVNTQTRSRARRPIDHVSILLFVAHIFDSVPKKKGNKPVSWVRPSDRRLSVKLVPTFCDREYHVVRTTDSYGRILRFLDRSSYFFCQVPPQLYSRGWVDAVPDPLLLRKFGSAGNRIWTSWSVARNSDHLPKTEYGKGGCLSLGVRQVGRENVPLPLATAEVTNVWG
jgi:hypothetical protein